MFVIYIIVEPENFLYLSHYKNYKAWTTDIDDACVFDSKLQADEVCNEYLYNYTIDLKIMKKEFLNV